MNETGVRTRLAKVVHVVDGYSAMEVVINRGAADGVKLGDRFLVFGEGPHIADPDTGRDLGQLELVRGRGQVVHVQDQMATVRTIERRRTRPAKRIVRTDDRGLWSASGLFKGNVVEEELAPEEEMPFESVHVGDQAKPI
jgi:hypothetical protein